MFVLPMMKAWIIAPRGKNWKGAGDDMLKKSDGVYEGALGPNNRRTALLYSRGN